MSNDLTRLAALAAALGDDERAVLVAIAERLTMGARQYGPLDIATDRRDWEGEAGDEAFDGCVYLACNLLARRRRRGGDPRP